MTKAKATAVLGTLFGAGLWLAGAWDATSSGYWRIHAQSAQLLLAEKMPDDPDLREYRVQLARSALRTHLTGIANEELERAASVLEKSSRPREAAILLLALVRRDTEVSARKRHAANALRLNPSVNPLLNLITLSRHDQDERSRWVARLHSEFPKELIGLGLRCLDEYGNLALSPPRVCTAVEWASSYAEHRHREYQRVARTIATYPTVAAQEIDKLQVEVDGYRRDQVRHRSELDSLRREASQLGWTAAGEFVLDMLPLPKPGDTAGTFIAREGLCVSKWVNWLCAIASAGEALGRMDRRKAELASRANNLVSLINGASQLAQYDFDRIEEWRSGKKLEDFQSELDSLKRWFWSELDAEIFRRMPELGLDFEHVMNDIVTN